MSTQLRGRLSLLLLFALLVGSLSSCRFGRAAPTPPALPPGIGTGSTLESAAPETFSVQRGEVVQQETLTGRVTPLHQEDLFFRRSGRLAEVLVEDGQLVEEGDLIATLDNEVLEIDLESALIGLAIAKENMQQAKTNLEIRRQQADVSLEIYKLRLAGVSARVDANDASIGTETLEKIRQLELRQAELNRESVVDEIDPILELNLKRAELAVERVKQSILEGQITAPFSGEVRFIDLPEEDEQVAVQGYVAVARLVDSRGMKIELNLPRAQLETLSEGMAVEVTAASLAGRVLPGAISALPRPFGTSQGSLTEVTLTNADDNSELPEGITVAVDVRLRSKADSLVIPRSVLQEEDGLYYVTIQEGDLMRRVNVAAGVISTDLVEITAGLEEGQTVVAVQ